MLFSTIISFIVSLLAINNINPIEMAVKINVNITVARFDSTIEINDITINKMANKITEIFIKFSGKKTVLFDFNIFLFIKF